MKIRYLRLYVCCYNKVKVEFFGHFSAKEDCRASVLSEVVCFINTKSRLPSLLDLPFHREAMKNDKDES